MHVRRTLTLVATVTSLILAGVAGVAGGAAATASASTARGLTQCQIGHMCFWHDQVYRSTFFALTDSKAHLRGNSDEAHSVWNRSSVAWILYDDNTFDESDRHFCMRPGVRNRDIGAPAYKFGDKITSAKRLETSLCPPGVPLIDWNP